MLFRSAEAALARPVAQSFTPPNGQSDLNERQTGIFGFFVGANAFTTSLVGAPTYRGGTKTGDLKAVTVALSGSGRGTVSSAASGISCSTSNGDACTAQYASTNEIVLLASPNTGSRFGGWSGACTGTGACVLAMDTARSVTARFDPVP